MIFHITGTELQTIYGYLFSQSVWIGCLFIFLLLAKNIFKWHNSVILDNTLFLLCLLMLSNFISALQIVFTSGLKTLFGF